MISYVIVLATLACAYAAGEISSYPIAHHRPVGYHGPLARPVVRNDGYFADTHEVAAARNAQYVALANAAARSAGYGHQYYYGHDGSYRYVGGHGVYSYGPTTGYIYGGQYGYDRLYPASYGNEGRGVYSYGHNSYAGHHSAPYYQGYDYYGHGNDGYGSYGGYHGHADNYS